MAKGHDDQAGQGYEHQDDDRRRGPGVTVVVEVLENVATAALTVFALALSFVGLRAWRHSGSPKVALLATGFVLFFVKGLVLSAGLFVFTAWESLLLPSILFDLAILGVFYLAILR